MSQAYYPEGSTDCVLVDLDGTLADCDHRKHFLECSPKNWKEFLDPARVSEDVLIESVARVVRALADNYPIVYVSGRTRALYKPTIEWLERHGLWMPPHKLYMRSLNDLRSDVIVKRQLLVEIRRDWNPWLAIDDRNSVVAMWRDEGLTCFQVSDDLD